MPRATATFNGKVIAEASTWEYVEGNIYARCHPPRRKIPVANDQQFPPSSVDQSVLSKATLTTHCPWKGEASYYNISVDGKEAKDAAWYYPAPVTDKAAPIKDHVAFYKTKVEITSE